MNPIISPVIEVRGLTVEFNGVPAVKLVDLNISKGHIVGIVGESGSGKSTLASALIGLLPDSARITSGQIFFDGWHYRLRAGDDYAGILYQWSHRIR